MAETEIPDRIPCPGSEKILNGEEYGLVMDRYQELNGETFASDNRNWKTPYMSPGKFFTAPQLKWANEVSIGQSGINFGEPIDGLHLYLCTYKDDEDYIVRLSITVPANFCHAINSSSFVGIECEFPTQAEPKRKELY